MRAGAPGPRGFGRDAALVDQPEHGVPGGGPLPRQLRARLADGAGRLEQREPERRLGADPLARRRLQPRTDAGGNSHIISCIPVVPGC